MNLVNELLHKSEQLTPGIKKLGDYGRELALCERNYKIAVNQKALELRADKMAVGMITMTIYGYKDIADLRFKRDVAETMYQTAKEGINALKLQIRVIQGQLDKEWGNAKRDT
jgi:hypothetical protein